MSRPHILALSGSTRHTSVNKVILETIRTDSAAHLDVTIYDELTQLPYFNPDLTDAEHLPETVKNFLAKIEKADGIILCTPEYVFSLPGILKNAIEWCVATTVFTDKPTALIVASLSGQKAFESLDIVMTTVGAKTTPDTKLLITGAYSKLDKATHTLEMSTRDLINKMMISFRKLLPERP